jgi:hypothetical protein
LISDNIDACSREYPGFHFQHDKANSENILVLRHVPRVIKLYQEHFKTRWEYGVPNQKGDLA